MGAIQLNSDHQHQLLSGLPGLYLLVDSSTGAILFATGQGLRIYPDGTSGLIGKYINNLSWLPVESHDLTHRDDYVVTTKCDPDYIEVQVTKTQTGHLLAIRDISQRIQKEIEFDQIIYQKTLAIEANQKEQREMLDSLQLAILTIDAGLKIKAGYSRHLQLILDRKDQLDGLDFYDEILAQSSLGQEQLRRFKFDLTTIFGGDELQWLCTAHAFPKAFKITTEQGTKHLKTRFHPLYDFRNTISKIMIIIEDVSDVQKLEDEASAKHQEVQMISDLIKVDHRVYDSFISETQKLFASCRSALTALADPKNQSGFNSIMSVLFRNIHTLKGSAGLFNLVRIQNAANDVEEYFASLAQKKITVDRSFIAELGKHIDHLEGEVAAYHQLRQKLFYAVDGGETEKFSKPHVNWLLSLINRCTQALSRPDLSPRDIDSLLYECRAALDGVGKSPLKYYIERFDELTGKLADRYQKTILPLRVYSAINYFETELIAKFAEIIVHCISNAVAHGIELPNQRETLHKPVAGKINIRFLEHAHKIRLIIEDDGKGIDPQTIAELCLVKGLITFEEAQRLTPEEKIALVFHSGLSSKAEADIWAGRGVGMDSVKDMVASLGGSIKIESEVNHGTRIIMDVPYRSQNLVVAESMFDLAGLLKAIMPAETGNQRLRPSVLFAHRAAYSRLLGEIKTWLKVNGLAIKGQDILRTAGTATSAVSFELVLDLDDSIWQQAIQRIDFREKFDMLRTLALDAEGVLAYEPGKLLIRCGNHLPFAFEDLNIAVMPLASGLAKAVRYMKDFCSENLGCDREWLASPNLTADSDQPTLCIALVEEGQLGTSELAAQCATLPEDCQAIVFSNNPDLLDAEHLDALPRPPVLAKLPMTKAQIEQVWELSLIQFVNGLKKGKDTLGSG